MISCGCAVPGVAVVTGGVSLRGWLQGPAGVEAVPPHVLLGAAVVLHLQAAVEDGLLLR